MVKNKTLAIIVPCFNEVKTIINTYNKTKIYGIPIIIDDCSNDGTRKILNSKKINFVKNKKRSGYEQTIINGFNYINKNLKEVKFIATIDADLELPPVNLSKLYKELKRNNLDIIVGSRNRLNRFSEYLLSFLFKVKFNINDPISGLKIYRKTKIERILNKVSNNLFLVDILILSFNKKLNIGSKKIFTKKRKDLPRVGNSLKVNLKIFKIIFYSIFSKKN